MKLSVSRKNAKEEPPAPKETIASVSSARSLASSITSNITSWFGLRSEHSEFRKGIHSTASANEVVSTVKKVIDVGDSDLALIAALTVVIEVCQHPQSERVKEALVSAGILNLLVQVLNAKGRSVGVIRSVIQVGCIVSEVDNNKSKVVSSNLHSLIILTVKSNMEDELVCQWGCKFLRNLAMDEVTVLQISALGACEIAVNVIEMHFASTATVETACRAIFGLCKNAPGNKNKVGGAGAPELIVKHLFRRQLEYHRYQKEQQLAIVEAYEDSVSLTAVECGLRVVGIMCQNHMENCLAYDTLGIVDIFIQLHTTFTDVNSAFVISLMSAVSHFAVNKPEYQVKLAASGMCDIILNAMTKYSEVLNVTVVPDCYRALRNICHNNDIVHAELTSKFASVLLIQSIQKFGKTSDTVSQWAWYAIASLANLGYLWRLLASGKHFKLFQRVDRSVCLGLFGYSSIVK